MSPYFSELIICSRAITNLESEGSYNLTIRISNRYNTTYFMGRPVSFISPASK